MSFGLQGGQGIVMDVPVADTTDPSSTGARAKDSNSTLWCRDGRAGVVIVGSREPRELLTSPSLGATTYFISQYSEGTIKLGVIVYERLSPIV